MRARGSRTCVRPRVSGPALRTVIRRRLARRSPPRPPPVRRDPPAGRPRRRRGAPATGASGAAGCGATARRASPCGRRCCGLASGGARVRTWVRTWAKGCGKGGRKAIAARKPGEYGGEKALSRRFRGSIDITCAGRTVVAEVRRIRRCGSSVVEHSLGKGEVESSILSRSTSFSRRQIKGIGVARAAGDRIVHGTWRQIFLYVGRLIRFPVLGSQRTGPAGRNRD